MQLASTTAAPLSPLPNQEIIVSGGWRLKVGLANGVMYIDAWLNDREVIRGHRLVANTPAIGYRHICGDVCIWLDTVGNELPDYRRFGIDQHLYIMSFAEIAALRGDAVVPITDIASLA